MENIELPLIIVANGEFPTHKAPLDSLKNAKTIVACDGAADKLIKKKIIPTLIIGDLDSLSRKLKENFKGQIIHKNDQSENDLRKAINYVSSKGIKDLTIIGATGKREDHTLGNIFSIIKYSGMINIKILTDTGYFTCVDKSRKIKTKVGQNISLFSPDNTIKVSSKGLKYNLNSECISTLFYGTLNESISKNLEIQISHGKLIIFQSY